MVAFAQQHDATRNRSNVGSASDNVLRGLADNEGAIRDVVDNSGAVAQHRTFNSFGKRISPPNTNTSAWDAARAISSKYRCAFERFASRCRSDTK
jgi:hypothetical protein